MAPTSIDVVAAPSPESVPALPRASVAYTDFDRVGRLAEGPRAVVSEALVEVEGRGRRVALVELRDRGGTTGREFVAAADEWAGVVDHDHAAGVLDWGKKPRPWIATEHLPGGSLRDRPGDVAVDEALWTGVCVASALRYAHQNGLVHGALAPASVRFQPTASEWDYPKVTGWGIDRLLGVRDDAPRYLAPEQVDDRFGHVGPATDVYRLGVVLYEVLTGESPYLDPGDARTAVRESTPIPPTTVDPSLPGAVDDLLLGAMEKSMEDRYATAVEFRRELVELLDVEGTGDANAPPTAGDPFPTDPDVDVRTFPMFDDDRAEWRATCPDCGRSINNTLSSFLAHWVHADRCDGPPTTPPAARSSHSAAEWEAILDAYRAIDAGESDGPGGTAPDHPLWTALSVPDTTVVAVDGVPVDTPDGSFPWLDYPRRGWRIPCPSCDETVFNARSAMMNHWADSPDCDGPPDEFRTA